MCIQEADKSTLVTDSLVPLMHYGEHAILLSRESVNKGMKRMNSLPLSPAQSFPISSPEFSGSSVTADRGARELWARD